MSVTLTPGAAARGGALGLRRWLIVLGALVAAFALIAALAYVAGASAAPPPKSPFGVGVREAAPGGAIGALLLDIQSRFYRAMIDALTGIQAAGTGMWTLLGIGFAYGVFHAAGPGHGKAVISGYIIASRRTLAKGLALSLAAALLQALVAIALVGVLSAMLKATAQKVTATTHWIELASFAAVGLFGLVMVWRRSGTLLAALSPEGAPAEACDHTHMPGAKEAAGTHSLRDAAGIVLAAGLRPCSGAIILLVFALSQSAIAIGIAAVLAMALGTALTTAFIAGLSVFAKGLALRLAGGRGRTGEIAIAGIEVLAAALVAALGASLALGLMGAGTS